MSSNDRMSDSTVARIAGNLMSGLAEDWGADNEQRVQAVQAAVATARAIVAEVRRTAEDASR